MASLTDQLSGVNSGKPIVNPGPQGPSFLGALADFGANSVGGLARLGEAAQRRRNEAVQDELAGRIFDIQTSATQALQPQTTQGSVVAAAPSGPVPFDSELAGPPPAFGAEFDPPGDVVAAANELGRAQRAVSQGRLNQGGYDLQLERLQAEMFQKYPDQRAEVAAYLQSRGIDSYMFRAFRAEQAAYNAEQTAQTNAITTQFQYAAERGLVTNETKLEDGARIGRQAIEAEMRLKAAKDAAEAARQERTLAAQEREARLKEAGNEATSALIGQVSVAVQPLLDQVGLALSAAGTDAERQTQLGEYRVRTQAALTTYKSRAITELASAGGTPDQIEYLTKFFDDQLESIDSMFTNSFETNSLAAKNLQASFNITAAQAMPAYSRLVAALGQPAVNAIFADPSGVIKLPPDVQAAVSQEMVNFNPADPRGAVSLSRMIGYLRGQEGLEDLTAEQASSWLKTNATVQQTNQAALLRGETGVAQNYLANVSNTAEAMVEIPPTTTDWNSLRIATNLNSTSAARQALAEAAKVDPEYAQAAAVASRNGAAKAMIAAKHTPLVDGPFDAVYRNGQWEARLTRESYNSWARDERARLSRTGFAERGLSAGGTTEVPSYEAMQRRIPPALATRVHVLNQNLTHLVETRQYDPTVANLSPRETRDLFARGKMPSTMVNSNADAPNADDGFDDLLEGLDTTLQNLITQTTSQALPVDANDLDWAVRTMLGEAASEGPEGLAAVAGVIRNRVSAGTFGGRSIRDVVLAPNQFEPWGNPRTRRRLERIDPNSRQYKEAYAIAEDVFNNTDRYPTYTHFYSPTAQASLGRNPPAWDDGSGVDIGRHRFFVNPQRRSGG